MSENPNDQPRRDEDAVRPWENQDAPPGGGSSSASYGRDGGYGAYDDAPSAGGQGQDGGYSAPGQYGSQYSPQGADGSQGQYGAQGTYGNQSQYGAGYPAQGQYAYGQPGGHQPYPAAPTGPAPKRTAPILLIVLGFLTMLFAPIIGFAMSIASFGGSAIDLIGEGHTVQPQGGSVSLEANTQYQILSVDFQAADSEIEQCTVTGPGGEDVAVRPMTSDGFDLGPTITTGEAGTYGFECPQVDGPLSISPTMDSAEVGEFAGTAVGSFMPLLIGAILSFIGLVVGIVGIVWLVRVNRRRRLMGY